MQTDHACSISASCAIFDIAPYRVSCCRQLGADLMKISCRGRDIEHVVYIKLCNDLIVECCLMHIAGVRVIHDQAFAAGFAQEVCERAAGRCNALRYDSEIVFVDRACLPLCGEMRCSLTGLCKNYQPGARSVEAVYDIEVSLTICLGHDQQTGIAGSVGLYRNTTGLGTCDEVMIIVQYEVTDAHGLADLLIVGKIVVVTVAVFLADTAGLALTE